MEKQERSLEKAVSEFLRVQCISASEAGKSVAMSKLLTEKREVRERMECVRIHLGRKEELLKIFRPLITLIRLSKLLGTPSFVWRKFKIISIA